MLKIYNTLSRKLEEFISLESRKVGMYTCGPTVYGYTHIGHLRKYTSDDILVRVLVAYGYEVKHVMNITDVGHLTSDEDQGDDKLEKGAKERNESVWEVAKYFTDYFIKSTLALNIYPPDNLVKATDHIKEQIKLIQILEKKGFIYQTEQAIYFDVSKFPNYGKLTGQKLEEKTVGVRQDVRVDPKKKNPADFALWFFTVGHFKDHVMRWNSPWGEGFPGWHIECSAMSMEYLGNTLDIHTGGIDHIPVHHTNEIAQSEAATGEQFVRYWVHHNFLRIDQVKMSKSLKNLYTIDDIRAKGFDPLALRYLFLTAHYREELNFSWDSLQAGQTALNNLREIVRDWNSNVSEESKVSKDVSEKFLNALGEDLNTSKALAVVWEMVKSDFASGEKAATILEMDKVLGLGLSDYVGKKIEIPAEVQKLLNQREKAREEKDFEKSDELRKEIKKMGYEIEDFVNGVKVKIIS